MKKMFTLIMALLAFQISGLANTNSRQSSSLFLRFTQNADYTVTVNGMRYFDVNGQLAIHYLPPGNHRVKVIARTWRRSGRSVRNVFVQYVQVPFNSTVTAMVNPHQGIRVTRVTRHQAQRPRANRRYRQAPPARGGGRGDGYYRNPNQRNNQYRRGGAATNVNGIDATIRRMQDSGFDSDRLAIAKRHIQNNRVSSIEVARMMRAMSYESTKLQLAKFAHGYTIDPQNYEVVFDALTFQSSKRTLDRYIQ